MKNDIYMLEEAKRFTLWKSRTKLLNVMGNQETLPIQHEDKDLSLAQLAQKMAHEKITETY